MANSPSAPDLWTVVAPACIAGTLGLLGATFASLRGINPELRFELDVLGWAGGFVGAGAGWWIGRGVARLADPGVAGDERQRLRRRVIGGLAALGLVTILGFALAAHGLPGQRRGDMLWGSLLALMVLGGVAWLLRRLALLFGGTDDPDEDPPGGG